MSLEALSVWKESFASQVKAVKDEAWKDNFPNWFASVFNAPKLSLPGLLIAVTPLPLTWGKDAFKAIFSTMTAQSNGAVILGNAWEAGMLASTVQVKAGDSIGVASPATTWSSVTSSVFTPASIAASKAKVLEIAGALPTKNALESQAPVIFREATLLLKVTTTGLDSTPSPAGPLPLVDAERAVG